MEDIDNINAEIDKRKLMQFMDVSMDAEVVEMVCPEGHIGLEVYDTLRCAHCGAKAIEKD